MIGWPTVRSYIRAAQTTEDGVSAARRRPPTADRRPPTAPPAAMLCRRREQVLIEHGAETGPVNLAGSTPFFFACQEGNFEVGRRVAAAAASRGAAVVGRCGPRAASE